MPRAAFLDRSDQRSLAVACTGQCRRTVIKHFRRVLSDISHRYLSMHDLYRLGNQWYHDLQQQTRKGL